MFKKVLEYAGEYCKLTYGAILIVANSEIVQTRTHDELMQEDGIYRNFITVRNNSKGWSKRSF